MKIFKCLFFIIFSLNILTGAAQNATSQLSTNLPERKPTTVIDSTRQKDAIDVLKKIFNKNGPDTRKSPGKLNFSIVPAVGYSLSTGFAVNLTGNVAFYTSAAHTENLSAINAEAILDTKGQKIFISRFEIYKENNNYKLTTDLRIERYPDDTYGLGSSTTNAKDDPINFSYIRTYATLFKKIIPNYYLGFGFNVDHHYNISETGNKDKTVSEFKSYGFSTHTNSSG